MTNDKIAMALHACIEKLGVTEVLVAVAAYCLVHDQADLTEKILEFVRDNLEEAPRP